MASTLVPTITPDTVISFEINPGTLLQFLETRAEGGPRLKCFEGSVTLVTPGMSHEIEGEAARPPDSRGLSRAPHQVHGSGVDDLDVAVRGRGHRV